ncbi:hypothetical protein Emag_004147 [Eimeria magna]
MGPSANREALPFSRHCRPGAPLLRLARGPLPLHSEVTGGLPNLCRQALGAPHWLPRSPQPKHSPVPLPVQQQQQLGQQPHSQHQHQHVQWRRDVSAFLSRFANIRSCSSVEAASVRQRGGRVYLLHEEGPPHASLSRPHAASFRGLSTPLLQRSRNGGEEVHLRQHPQANALPTATAAVAAAAAAATAAVEEASAQSAAAVTATGGLPEMFDEQDHGQEHQGAESHSFQQQQQQQQQMEGPRCSPAALHQMPLQQHLHEQQQLLQLHQHLLQQQQQHLRQQQLRGRRPQQPGAAALQEQQQIFRQREQQLQQQIPLYNQQGLQQAQETQQQQQAMPLQLRQLQQHELQQPYELQNQQHALELNSFEEAYQPQQQHALLQQQKQQQECGQQQQELQQQQQPLGLLEQEDLQQQDEDLEQQERLAAELYFVEQQLAEKEALLSLFEGALEKQQQLQVEEQLKHLQQQQQQLQQLLELIEQQKQELAEQRQQVEAQQRQLQEALLQQQQQEAALEQQQALQQAAVNEQQQQQQWFKEQQQAFAAAQDEFAAKQQQQQQQQQELTELHDLLQQQEAELTEKQQQQQQQQQLLLQQTREVQASIRLQGVQLLQQHQALQRQLQQQRELQQQILEYQRQQLRETEEALTQKQQQQHQHHLLLLQHDRSVSAQLPSMAGGSTLRQQQRHHQHLQQHKLQQLLQQQQVQQIKLQEELQQQLLRQERQYEEVAAAHWCSCEPEGSPATALGAPKAFKLAGAPQSAADNEGRRWQSYESTRLPSEEHRKMSGTTGRSIPKLASRAPQKGAPSSPHVEGREEEAASKRLSARGRSEGPHGTPPFRAAAAADGEESKAHVSSSANHAPHRTGGPRRTTSIPSGGSTCPPRLLRSTESQRLREKSLQEHLKVLQVAKRPVGPRGAPKRPAENGRFVSTDSVPSPVSPVRNKSSGGAVQGETPRKHSQHLNSGGPETRGSPRDPFSPRSARLGGPLTPPGVRAHEASGWGPPMGGGGSPSAWRRQPHGLGEASLTGGSVMPSPLGTKQQQLQLQQLLQEQRRVINLLLLEKQQLEREATGAGGGGPPSPDGIGLSPRTQGGPWKPRAFPREPYVKESRACAAQEGDIPGCVCGGDHPRTAWGPLDAALAEAHNNNAGLQRWTKVNEGVYFYGDTQVTLSFVNGRLMAQTDAGPLVWNKGARGDVLKFIKASDERFLQRNAAA